MYTRSFQPGWFLSARGMFGHLWRCYFSVIRCRDQEEAAREPSGGGPWDIFMVTTGIRVLLASGGWGQESADQPTMCRMPLPRQPPTSLPPHTKTYPASNTNSANIEKPQEHTYSDLCSISFSPPLHQCSCAPPVVPFVLIKQGGFSRTAHKDPIGFSCKQQYFVPPQGEVLTYLLALGCFAVENSCSEELFTPCGSIAIGWIPRSRISGQRPCVFDVLRDTAKLPSEGMLLIHAPSRNVRSCLFL